MQFSPPLVEGRLIRRYKRFLADVEVAGRIETAHCANPGSMLGLAEPGALVWLSASDKPSRKLRLTWELVDVAGHMVGINTALANRLATDAIAEGAIPALMGYSSVRREVPYGEGSRVDLLLTGPGRPPCYVEVKSVTMRRQVMAEFPDSVTRRGLRHLRELSAMRRSGARAVMLFVAQRNDCRRFSIAADIDPDYAAGLSEAESAGVEVLAYACRVGPTGIDLASPLQIALGQP